MSETTYRNERPVKNMQVVQFASLWLFALSVSLPCSVASAQFSALASDRGPEPDTRRDGEWLQTNMDGYVLSQRVIKLAPQAEPQPALSVVLIPHEFDLIDGNAAVQYLQAISFAEQTNAQNAMREFQQKNVREAQATGKNIAEVEPYVWLKTAPADLPLEDVRKYLSYSGFQVRFLEQAVQRRHLNFDRNIQSDDNPIGYLLPEIQVMRELARLQSMRFRLAIAEGRSQDALKIFGQQLALGHHLDDEDFLVSNLVGIACASIGINDAYYLSESSAAPNMYWAIASLPQPLVSMRQSMAYEREFLFEQFKQFREVDETPQPPIYWQRFMRGITENLASAEAFGARLPQDMYYTPAGLATMVAAAYPGAKLFLVEELQMDATAVEELPIPQVVFLAIRRLYERQRDEFFKLQYIPSSQRAPFAPDDKLRADRNKYGWVTALSDLFLPAVQTAMGAKERLQQQLALLQTLESLRDYLASHDGQLPQKLSDLRLPAPQDPITQQPFAYVREEGRAKLSGAVATRIKYEFEIVPTLKK
ncbi:MAG: hypothetical protein R3C53_14425 [Pirellulaceae bacterium]